MSTALANPTEVIRQGAPHLIHSDEELAKYTKALFKLTAKSRPTPEEEEAIELLTLLIERYEAERYPVPEADPSPRRGLVRGDDFGQLDNLPKDFLLLAGGISDALSSFIGIGIYDDFFLTKPRVVLY
jgi:HTH-type transcriptional regulator/antitoxin HigA